MSSFNSSTGSATSQSSLGAGTPLPTSFGGGQPDPSSWLVALVAGLAIVAPFFLVLLGICCVARRSARNRSRRGSTSPPGRLRTPPAGGVGQSTPPGREMQVMVGPPAIRPGTESHRAGMGTAPETRSFETVDLEAGGTKQLAAPPAYEQVSASGEQADASRRGVLGA